MANRGVLVLDQRGAQNDDVVEIVETIDGAFMVLVNGWQWGPPDVPVDTQGASYATWPTMTEAEQAWADRHTEQKGAK